MYKKNLFRFFFTLFTDFLIAWFLIRLTTLYTFTFFFSFYYRGPYIIFTEQFSFTSAFCRVHSLSTFIKQFSPDSPPPSPLPPPGAIKQRKGLPNQKVIIYKKKYFLLQDSLGFNGWKTIHVRAEGTIDPGKVNKFTTDQAIKHCFSLQNHPTFHSEEMLVNLARGRECFVGLSILLVYALPLRL